MATTRVLCNQLPSDQTLTAGRALGDEWTNGAMKSDGNETNGNWKPLGFVVACDGSPDEKGM